MREYPVFIPFREEHLAGVVTVPSRPARGFVLFLQGAGGAPRTHKYRLWTRTGRALAELGLASIRMDYVGIGDSTGKYRFAMEAPPVDEAMAAARLGLERLGVDDFAVVGNCIGARTALALSAGMETCVSVACIVPMALGPVMAERGAGAAGGLLHLAKRRSPLGRMVRRVTPRRKGPVGFVPEAASAVRTSRLMFLHGGTEQSWEQLRAAASKLEREAGPRSGDRVHLWTMPSEGRSGFRPLANQQAVIDSIVRWMDLSFPAEAQPRARPGAA